MYKFKTGKSYKGLEDANLVGETLEKIRQKNGQLLTQEVVDEARKKTSPLHNAFTWDDKKAADEFRLEEARHLIRVMVLVVDETEKTAFINVHLRNEEGEDEQYYQSINTMTVDETQIAMASAQTAIKVAVRRLEELKEVAKGKKKKNVQLAISDVKKAQSRL